MKKMTLTYLCDRCGKDVTGHYFRLKPHLYEDEKEIMSYLLIESMDREFCEDCVRTILDRTRLVAGKEQKSSGG